MSVIATTTTTPTPTPNVTEATAKLSQKEIIPTKTDVGALANRINLETQTLHNKVDKMVTLKMAIALRNYKVFRQGLQAFYHVFATIETCLQNQLENDPNSKWSIMLQQVWKPEIARKAKAEQDLLFFYDDNKSKFINAKMVEQINFVNHIKQVTSEKPYLLFAYFHVMYLALFAGGRIMRSSFTKATGMYPKKDGLTHDQIVKLGTNFFTFDVADEDMLRVIYKRDYELATRNGLTEEQKLEIIEESKYIFEQNVRCLVELEEYNLEKIHGTWTYFAFTKGTYAVAIVLCVLLLLYAQRILSGYL
ncbi:HMX1 [Candida oxycetoniae]|uniref:HMX1 n=1 Tax=Candida oxycetoniae TaxID=497107 RepID=A0AAI9SYY9_9ASCO|nr:HMX1 [Candida oxycetoniae]KAI3405372.2 HMX1 [Candida oxycetoniae]